MSRKLKLSVKNLSSHTVRSFSVCHTWDGHGTVCKGTMLANDQESPSVEMTSGSIKYDWLTRCNLILTGWEYAKLTSTAIAQPTMLSAW